MANVRGMGTFNIRVVGLTELDAQFRRVGRFPKKYLTKSAREGMAGPLADARTNAGQYKKDGIMQRSIKKKMETPNKRNKAVYRLIFSEKYTDHFLKDSSGIYGGKPPKAYYPHSVEYGYKTKKGRVEGKYFITRAIQANQQSSLQKVVDSLNHSIDNLLR